MSDKDLYHLICLFREFIDIYIDPNDSEYSDYLDVLRFILFIRDDEQSLDKFVGCPYD